MRRAVNFLMDNRLTQTQRERSRRLRWGNARRVGQIEYDFDAMTEALLLAGLIDVRHCNDEERVDRGVEKLLEIICE